MHRSPMLRRSLWIVPAGGLAVLTLACGGAGGTQPVATPSPAAPRATAPVTWPGPAASPSPAASPGSTISATAGQTFQIRLDSNHTTGYEWQVQNPPDDKIVQVVGSKYQASSTKAIGAGGEEIWTFRAVAPGTTRVTLGYLRPWEKDVAPVRTQTYTITVR